MVRAWRRKPLSPVVAFSVAAALWIGSSLGQGITYSQMKPLPVDLQRTVTTQPAATALYNPQRDCPANAPFSCYITATESYLERHLTTSPEDDDDEALLQVQESLQGLGSETLFGDLEPSVQGAPSTIYKVADEVSLIRHSTYPVLEPTSSIEIAVPEFDAGLASTDFIRDGLQYFFPFNTERRSYQYFDIFAQDAWPLDYVREENGHFIFEQKIPAVNLKEAAERAYTHPVNISDDAHAVNISDDAHAADAATTAAPAHETQELISQMQLHGTVASFYPAEYPELISTQNFNSAAGSLPTADDATPADRTETDAAPTAGASSTENTAAAVPDATNPEQNSSLTPIELPAALAQQHPSGTQEIAMTPYYTVTRTVEVEPKSGVIVDQTEDIFFFFAYDDAEAATLAASSENQRTILRTTLAWEEETQEAALAQAAPITTILQTVRVIGFIMNVIALGFLVTGFVLITRRPRTTGKERGTQRIGLE